MTSNQPWRKATASNPSGCCAEVSLPRWRKASASAYNGSCVEFALLPAGMVGLRDSKDPGGPVLAFTPDEWTAFLDGVGKGEFGLAAQ